MLLTYSSGVNRLQQLAAFYCSVWCICLLYICAVLLLHTAAAGKLARAPKVQCWIHHGKKEK